jgi:16S rRNA (guanine527-N7)-methyltransferase
MPSRELIIALLLALIHCCSSFQTKTSVSIRRQQNCFVRIFETANTNNDDISNEQKPQQHIATLDYASIVLNDLQLSQNQFEQLQSLCELLFETNQHVNLMSRKDCTTATIWEKHILPSLAVLCCSSSRALLSSATKVLDVGTGGGFPGLPLAIAYPDTQFVLIDSVGKKVAAVQSMVNALELRNVKTHVGRAEAYTCDADQQLFDVALGRSVSALPQFCSWMHHVLKKDTGRLLYWMGGDIPEHIQNRVIRQVHIEELFPCLVSDKRVLTFPQIAVSTIAEESGVKVRVQKQSKKVAFTRDEPRTSKKKETAKGAWQKRDRNEPKQRGFDGFKRYESTGSIQS